MFSEIHFSSCLPRVQRPKNKLCEHFLLRAIADLATYHDGKAILNMCNSRRPLGRLSFSLSCSKNTPAQKMLTTAVHMAVYGELPLGDTRARAFRASMILPGAKGWVHENENLEPPQQLERPQPRKATGIPGVHCYIAWQNPDSLCPNLYAQWLAPRDLFLHTSVARSVANRAKDQYSKVRTFLLQRHVALTVASNTACLLMGLAPTF